jgi:GntR family transcriptional regulator
MRNLNSHSKPKKPLYQLVEDHIMQLIDGDKLVPGDLIPSEPQLAKQLNVSSGTVKKAIDNLVWRNKLYRHQGKGTYVSNIDFNNSLFRFTTYGNAEGEPTRLHKETTAREIQTGKPEICEKLSVDCDAPLLYIERVGSVDDEPVMIEYSHWRADMLPGLESEDIHIPDLFYALIVEKYRIPIVRANEILTAEAADQHTANKLNIEPGTPVLVLHRMTYTTENRLVEVRISKGRSDRFSYKAEIR